MENDPRILTTLRKMRREGAPCIGLLRYLSECNLPPVEMMLHFEEAFDLSFSDVSCIGGWFSDGSGELSDDQIDSLLENALRFSEKGDGVD